MADVELGIRVKLWFARMAVTFTAGFLTHSAIVDFPNHIGNVIVKCLVAMFLLYSALYMDLRGSKVDLYEIDDG